MLKRVKVREGISRGRVIRIQRPRIPSLAIHAYPTFDHSNTVQLLAKTTPGHETSESCPEICSPEPLLYLISG